MGDSRRYRAFISYSHSDARVAARLHRSLENYRVPKRLRATPGEFGPVPERLSPIFRDREELASSADLGQRVQDALGDSDALLVVCSPHAARSRWVNEEVLAFKRLGGSRRIYCLIVAGEPNAGDARECFPPALRFEIEADGQLGKRPAEPIAADLRPGKDGATNARLKLIAGLLGVGFDALRQREAQRRHRRMAAIAIASLAGMTLALVLAATAWIERNNARRQQALAEAASQDARRRQAQAEGMLGFLLDDLRPKLQKVGQLDLLDTVDEKADKYFASLDPGDLNDNTLARQAQTLTGIGQVRLSQGRFHEALESFQSAYARSSALVDRHPGDASRLFDRGQAEYWVGYVHWQSRDLDQAQTWLTRYRDTSREVYELDPKNIDWEHELAYGDHNLAVLELERGQLEVAAAAFARARTTFESVLAKNPNDPQFMFDVADEASWQGNAQEQLGHLDRAGELLAEKSERVRAISAGNPNEPKWKVEWSTAQVMQSELLRIRGRNAEAYSIANEAVERMKPLTVLDPSNKEWSQDYLYALLMRAAAGVGVGKRDQARNDLALAQPLLDALAQTEASDRHVRRDLLDAGSLRILLALQDNDRAAARAGADALHALDRSKEAAPTSAEDAGRYGLSQVAAGMAAAAAGRQSDADVYFSAARRVLEPLAKDSRYWRVLDPWARLARLSGDATEADRVETQLSGYGYVPLF
ncbi:MAG TPA: toll/interleukin-1 receptor domain-containing protein, partial [Rudaea sp.]|nr:toll/interleukin-1 receptor domain-containing protein [Rudaea sp.]